jgi:ribosomal protein S18 acetylase RimI-like enzyme
MATLSLETLLENIAWHSMTGPQAALSVGTGGVRRYARGYSPILAFADPTRANLVAIEPHCESGEHFYCGGWSGAAPPGWRIAAETTLVRMLWAGTVPEADEAFAAVRLGPEHVAQVLDLVELTQPGPFGPRNLELGEYFGCFEGPRLVAMAGERMFAGTLREVSGVCTHPEFQGRGLARRLMHRLMRREMQRGETPLLHVRRSNTTAHDLYERMGFEDRQEMVNRVLTYCP